MQLMGIVIVVGVLVSLMFGTFIGSDFMDYSINIVGGYSYEDVGRDERYILYSSGKGLPMIVIDSRVDDYNVVGDLIYVARRPVEDYKEGDVLNSRLKNICEYWVINVSNNDIEKIDSALPLKCK